MKKKLSSEEQRERAIKKMVVTLKQLSPEEQHALYGFMVAQGILPMPEVKLNPVEEKKP